MQNYYAKLFEDVLIKPDDAGMEDDLAQLRERVVELVRDQRVLELACGAGAWTAELARSAAHVTATDITLGAVEAAQQKLGSIVNVDFAVRDAFDLQFAGNGELSGQPFTVCFGALFWSHIKRQDQAAFLAQISKNIGKDVLLIMLDRIYIDGVSPPIARTDFDGNTYENSALPDGERFEIVRNFPTDSALRKKIGQSVRDLRIFRVEYYWMMTCRLK